MFDNYGTLITELYESYTGSKKKYYATPTPILSSTIDYTASANAGFLVYKANDDDEYMVPSIARKTLPNGATKKTTDRIVTGDGGHVKFEYFEDNSGRIWVKRTFHYYEIIAKSV